MTRVAVIGVGSMGKNHARVYSEMPEAELAAVSDNNPETAEKIGAHFGVTPYQDYRQMLEKEKPEAVTISVPTALHYEVGMTAMEAGAHVLIEKPISATLEEGRALIQAADRLGRHLMIGHIVRFNAAHQELKKRLENNELGRVFQIFCRRAGPFPARIRDVGVIVDLAPHDIDIMRYLTGESPERVYAEIEQRIHTDHEDLLFALLRFPGHVTGALEINWLTPTKVREVLVIGERGMFRVDDLTQDLYFYENSQATEGLWHGLQTIKGVSEGSMIRYAIQRREPLRVELESFVRAVRGDAPITVTGEDGLEALRLSLLLIESGQTHQTLLT
jgi:UDP-N-acetylglucosamine 3-dehydrogenase